MNQTKILILSIIAITLIIYPDDILARAGGGGGGGGSGGGGILGLILAPFFMIYSAIITYIATKKNKQCKNLIKRASVRDKFWDHDSMKYRIEETYFMVQEAWMERDQDIAKEYMSKRLYDSHKLQTDRLLRNRHKNILENINLRDAKIVEVLDFKDNSKDSFWALIRGSMVDYTINEKTNKIIDGANKNIAFKELWRFKREDHGWVLDEIDSDVSISDLKTLDSSIEISINENQEAITFTLK